MAELDYEAMFPRRPTDSYIVPGHQKHNHEGMPVATGRAVLWVLPDGHEEWFPRQQIIEHKQDALLITEWLAAKKGYNKQTDWTAKAEDSMYEEARLVARHDYGADYDDEISF
jgi:hypothetical protein